LRLRVEIPSKITPQAAVELQKKLAPLVRETSELPSKIENLVGCDATYFRGLTLAAATEVDYEELTLKKSRSVLEPTVFPYIPGLLAFREAPSVLKAIRSLNVNSYVCLVDAHGIAHPRKFGLACFVGLALDRPTIGVGKSLLCGRVEGNHILDEDKYPIAEIVTLPKSGKDIYVSIGHKISLKDAVEVVKHCSNQQGPVPLNLAHQVVSKQRCLIEESNQVS